jgi:hypothetical protein
MKGLRGLVLGFILSAFIVNNSEGASKTIDSLVLKLNCTGEGQVLNGAKYTEVNGSISIDMPAQKASFEVLEKTLPPFDKEQWTISASDLTISEYRVKRSSRTIELVLMINYTQQGIWNAFYELDLELNSNLDSGNGKDINVDLTHQYDYDDGERGPSTATNSQSYRLVCR